MIEKKIIKAKKDEFATKEFIKKEIGKGKLSSIRIERTPIGEKIIIRTSKPGLVIGKRGESIQDLTAVLKKKFNLENPKLEIEEIEKPEFDSQSVADEIAIGLERFGSNSFKLIAYRALEKVRRAGGMGCEIILRGKLPSERARKWRFFYGYLMKTGESAKLVDRAEAIAQTKPGTVGIKVAILSPDVKLPDKIEV